MIMSVSRFPLFLSKNMTDKVILGLPFINALYPFLIEHDGITFDPFGQKVKFKFASKFEIYTNDALKLIHAKTKHLNFLKQEVSYKRIAIMANNNFNFCKPFWRKHFVNKIKLRIIENINNTFIRKKSLLTGFISILLLLIIIKLILNKVFINF